MTSSPPETREQIEQTITGFVREAPENRLPEFDNCRVFDAPLVGVSDGDGDFFRTFRRSVSPNHILPREILEKHAPAGTDLAAVRVISWALPYSAEVRRSNRGIDWPSNFYSVARNNGGALNWQLRGRLVDHVRQNGYAAISPALTEEYDAFRSAEYTFSSTWSERHVAFASGLGLFGLNGLLITRRGTMVRLGSLVTNLPLPLPPRGDSEHRAPCLQDGGRRCGLCLDRCPVGAISSAGLDKTRCYARRKTIRETLLQHHVRTFHMIASPIIKSGQREPGFSLGCALCAAGVPCETSTPPLEKKA